MKLFWDSIDRDYFEEISAERALEYLDQYSEILKPEIQPELISAQASQTSVKTLRKFGQEGKSQTPRPSHL